MPDAAPEDPTSPLQDGATQSHEMFIAYINAGFSRSEAMEILLAYIANARDE